jgi:hypothetical protein
MDLTSNYSQLFSLYDGYYELQIKVLDENLKNAYTKAAKEHNHKIISNVLTPSNWDNLNYFYLLSSENIHIPEYIPDLPSQFNKSYTTDDYNKYLLTCVKGDTPSFDLKIQLGCVIHKPNNELKKFFIRLGLKNQNKYFYGYKSKIKSTISGVLYGHEEYNLKKYDPIICISSSAYPIIVKIVDKIEYEPTEIISGGYA